MQINIRDNIVTIDGIEYIKRDHNSGETVEIMEDQLAQIETTLDEMITHGQALYDDFKREGLSFGQVEAEGYLRAVKEMKHRFNEIVE